MSSLNLNKVVLAGHVTQDVELKQTTSQLAVATFSLAVNRRQGKDEAERKVDFINVVAWRKTAEFISRYFRKGDAICITGSIQTRSWQAKDGSNRYATEVVADEAYFVDSKPEQAPTQTYNEAEYIASAPKAEPKYTDIGADQDLPF